MKAFVLSEVKLVVSIVLLFSSMAFAEAKTIKQLLEQSTRPTIDELALALGANIKDNPFPYVSYNQLGKDQLKEIDAKLPMIIVELERAFPGAIYAGVGRDMALLTDALQAFYTSIGQKDRVIHVPLSAESFESEVDGQMKKAAPELIYTFINQLPGVDLEHIESGKGLVFLD